MSNVHSSAFFEATSATNTYVFEIGKDIGNNLNFGLRVCIMLRLLVECGYLLFCQIQNSLILE